MALWVWRFVEGEPPHFFRATMQNRFVEFIAEPLYYYICGVWGEGV